MRAAERLTKPKSSVFAAFKLLLTEGALLMSSFAIGELMLPATLHHEEQRGERDADRSAQHEQMEDEVQVAHLG